MKRVMLRVIIFVVTLVFMLLTGCAGSHLSTYQSASSGKIGCPPKEIIITDLDQHGGFNRTRDWVATCDGQSYYCSGVNDGKGGTTSVSCIKKSSKKTSPTKE
jgi:hypothetical protein